MQSKYFFLFPLFFLFPAIVQAQPIVPATDGTGTVVTPDSTRYDITGGQTSADGANLFHSFTQFDLNADQTANFLSNPAIQNILSRVSSSNPSVIDGLIQVTGGSSNLYLMNPAGIVFGENARLDVPGSFTATTATGIGLGDQWFSATQPNNYAALIGTPSAFDFSTSGTPGTIVNAGQLSVAEGQNLSVLGGTVISTGELKAVGGQVTVATVPGQSLLRITQPGHLLSLEISPSDTPLTPLSLPQLLTGSGDTGIVVNSNGQAELAGSGLLIEDGDIVAKQITSQTATLSAQNNLSLVESTLQTTGDLNLLAQDTVRVRDSVANPFIAKAGGNLYIQGNQSIDILALNHPETPFQSGGNLSLVSDGIISGDAHYQSGGSFSILNRSGGFGNFYSLYDPIIDSGTDVALGDYTGVALKVISGGNITGGNITITGAADAATIPTDDPDFRTLTTTPALILDAAGSIDVGNIDTSDQGQGDAGLVRLTAVDDITTGNITTSDQGPGNAGSVTIISTQGNIVRGTIDTSEQGPGDSGAVTLTAGGTITPGNNSAIDQGEQGPGNQAGAPTITPNSPGTDDGGGTPDDGGGTPDDGGGTPDDGGGTPDDGGGTPDDGGGTPDDGGGTPDDGGGTPDDDASTTNSLLTNSLQQPLEQEVASTEDADILETRDRYLTSQFEKYFGKSLKSPSTNATFLSSQTMLRNVEKATGIKPAVIYVTFVPQTLAQAEANNRSSSLNFNSRNSEDQLELLLLTSQGVPIRKRVMGTTREKVLRVADQLRLEVTNVRSKNDYLFPGKQLHEWMIAPLEADLKAQGIENLAFVMDVGLRSLPMAALYDGQEFLIEQYSLGLVPTLALTDTRYKAIKDTQVLAMGAEKFAELKSLPAVPLELSTITSSLWQGKSFLNNAFTLQNLKAQRKQRPYGIIHLATHAVFRPGAPNNSYIQLWDTKLGLDQLSELDLNNPPVELLVLSACKTALGDEEAELGFAGLAVQAGAKSALASLWSVSDEGTLGLMTEVYEQLKQSPIKAEALRQTQLAMLKGQVQIKGGQLITTSKTVPLPVELASIADKTLQHPYYWASFTLVGSPW